MMKTKDKNHIIDLMYTENEKDEMYHLPDQWVKRNLGVVKTGAEDRYLVLEDGQVVDLYYHAYITLRTAFMRMSELLTYAKNNPNDQELCSKIRKIILNLENEFNISEIP